MCASADLRQVPMDLKFEEYKAIVDGKLCHYCNETNYVTWEYTLLIQIGYWEYLRA